MRVLFLTHVSDLAGANRSMLQLIRELKARYGVEPFVVCRDDGFTRFPNLESECRESGIPVLRMHLTWFKDAQRHGLLNAMKFIIGEKLDMTRLLWRLRHEHFDMVHSNSSIIDLGVYFATLRRIPHVWHLREFGQQDFGMTSRLGRFYEKFVYSLSTHFVAISQCISKAFSLVVPTDRITCIYNGVTPQPASLHATHDNPVTQLCVVGRIEPGKNQREVVEAARIMRESGVDNFHLTLIGADHLPYAEEIKMYVESQGLAPFVTFAGIRSDVPQLLKGMDIGVMASASEAFGRVTVEYMMQGLCVVASNTGANPEIVTHGSTGLMYNLGNPSELAEQLTQLCTSRATMLRIAQKGQEEALARFTSERNSEEIFQLYEKALS